MNTRDKKRTWADRVLTAFKARDEDALKEALEGAQDEMTNGVEGEGEGQTHRLVIEVKPPENDPGKPPPAADETGGEGGEEKAPAWFDAYTKTADERFGAIEGALAKLSGGTADADGDEDDLKTADDDELDLGKTMDDDGEGEGDKKDDAGKTADRRGVRDSAGLAADLQDLAARSEILVPGVRLPTFDSADPAKRTVDRMCKMRRRVLAKAFEDAEAREILEPLLGKKPNFTGMTCDGAKMAFVAASELMKRANSAVTTSGFVHDSGRGVAPATITDINAKNAAFWRKQGGLR